MADSKEDKKKARSEKKEQKKKEKEAKKNAANDAEDEDEEEGLGGKVLVAFVAIIIIVIWLAILALLVKMDVGGFGSTVLYPILKDVPVVNKILPEVEDYASEDSQYNYATVEDAVRRIKQLEKELKDAKNSSGTSDSYIADLEAQSKELAEYKAAQAAFEENKEKFYEEVVFSDKAPDINAYKAYYESIDPENAEIIYKQVVSQMEKDSAYADYAKTYSAMKPAQAASIFNTMTGDLNLVANILQAMSASDRGKILGAMNADTAAAVTKIMEP